MRTFAKTLRTAREAKFKSAASFAAHLNIEEATYRKYERGDSEPSYDTLVRICEELEITPNDLIPLAAQGKTGKNEEEPDPRAAA